MEQTMARDLQKEIADLGILSIETSGGIVSKSVIVDSIGIVKQTLRELDLDAISQRVEKNIKDFPVGV
ncbi:MAG: hypothetical protein Ta2B_13950 [Termitinemataceae bacterium]|nr:MAG: hypothetical protein Ta2B_13950 [Termitinemataceae bacterium]